MSDSTTNRPGAFSPTFSRQSHSGVIAFVMAVLLVVAAAGYILKYEWIVKQPVPWPKGVQVDDEYRMLSMPDSFGPYRAIRKGDALWDNIYSNPKNASAFAGPDRLVLEKNLGDLDMRTPFDEVRYDERATNWYAQRYYIDTRPEARYRYWQLNIYYYTGLKDTVAHVPDVCLQAGGGRDVGSGPHTFHVPNAAGGDSPWNQPLTFLRTRYQMRILRSAIEEELYGPGYQGGVAYFIFALNGKPVNAGSTKYARGVVRKEMNNLSDHYNYFAKIQFAPTEIDVQDPDDADAVSAEFIQSALPEILRVLPTADEVEALEKAYQAESKTQR